jgi:hypothetical protein
LKAFDKIDPERKCTTCEINHIIGGGTVKISLFLAPF